MAVKIPTMSTAGWIDSPHEKASYLIGAFIAAKYSQSTALYGRITTLQYLVQKYANRLVDLENELRTVFEDKVNAAFPDSATANVEVKQTDPENPAIYTIHLSCEVVENGKTHQVGKLVQFNGSVMLKIQEIANG